jgi:hypothetical protein
LQVMLCPSNSASSLDKSLPNITLVTHLIKVSKKFIVDTEL